MIIGGFAATAHAQSNVTIYGLIDAGLVSERGGPAGNVTKLTSGVSGQSRIGFKGQEDLGNGLATVFQFETGFKDDDGSLDSANTIFNRQAFVGLTSKDLGTMTLGRQYTPLYLAMSQVADPFAAGYAGNIKNLFPAKGNNTRTSNAINYSTANYQGFSADAQYALGEQAGDATAGRQFGAGFNYANGPLTARITYNNKNTSVAGKPPIDNSRNTLFAANYDFQVVKAFLAYGVDKGPVSAELPNANAFNAKVAPTPSTDSNEWLVGATMPVTAVDILVASYIKKNDKTSFNQDADQWGLGYQHLLSKRTLAYVAYAKIKNKNGAGYTVGNNNEAGTGDKAFNVGIRHSF